MEFKDMVVVVAGGAGGIGEKLLRALREKAARRLFWTAQRKERKKWSGR